MVHHMHLVRGRHTAAFSYCALVGCMNGDLLNIAEVESHTLPRSSHAAPIALTKADVCYGGSLRDVVAYPMRSSCPPESLIYGVPQPRLSISRPSLNLTLD